MPPRSRRAVKDAEPTDDVVMVGLAVSCVVNVIAMVWAGRPITLLGFRLLEPNRVGMAVWAALPYVVAWFVFHPGPTVRWAAVCGVLALSVGPTLVLGAKSWFGIDTRYNPIFMATPLLQIALFLPFGLVSNRDEKRSP